MKMIGVIKWYKEKKGYGYIIGADDDTYYFDINNCLNTKEIFTEGDKVLFIPNYEELSYATEVEKMVIENE